MREMEPGQRVLPDFIIEQGTLQLVEVDVPTAVSVNGLEELFELLVVPCPSQTTQGSAPDGHHPTSTSTQGVLPSLILTFHSTTLIPSSFFRLGRILMIWVGQARSPSSTIFWWIGLP